MVGKERQLGFGEFEGSNVGEADEARGVPGGDGGGRALLSAAESNRVCLSPSRTPRGRPPYPLEVMLRIHLMQNW